jgi:bacterioferritin (cytochrome b1)
MTPDEMVAELLAVERDARDLLREAARLARDPEERDLFARLARREEEALRELEREADLLDARRFVERALTC